MLGCVFSPKASRGRQKTKLRLNNDKQLGFFVFRKICHHWSVDCSYLGHTFTKCVQYFSCVYVLVACCLRVWSITILLQLHTQTEALRETSVNIWLTREGDRQMMEMEKEVKKLWIRSPLSLPVNPVWKCLAHILWRILKMFLEAKPCHSAVLQAVILNSLSKHMGNCVPK